MWTGPVWLLVTLIFLIVPGILLLLISFILWWIEDDKKEEEKAELNGVYDVVIDIESKYQDYIRKVHGGYYFEWKGIEELKNLKEDTEEDFRFAIQAFMDIKRIKLIATKDREKFYLVMYKYQETFTIILEKFEAAERMSLLDDPAIHRIIQGLLSEVLVDVERIQSMELGKIKQALEDERGILKGIREQKVYEEKEGDMN